MNDEISLTHPAVQATYEAYAIPISSLWNRGDHTFVYARNAALPGGGCDCRCYGRGIADVVAPAVVGAPGDDMQAASCMINMIPTVKSVYDSILDNCGIVYGIQGVCHNMTNRILTLSNSTILPLGTVGGYTLSIIVYGLFGNTLIPYTLRMLTSLGTASIYRELGMSLDENNDQKTKEWIFDPEIFMDCKAKLDKTVEYSAKLMNGGALKLLLQMEIFGVSTPANRLAALYQQHILDGDSSNLQDDQTLKDAIMVLNDFIKGIENTALLNERFRNMNAKMCEILGRKKYKKLFKEEYNEDLVLAEAFLKEEIGK